MKRWLLLLLPFVVLLVFVASWFLGQGKVKITYEGGTANYRDIKIYRLSSDDHEHDFSQDITQENLVYTFNKDETKRLRKGAYVAVADDKGNFDSLELPFNVSSATYALEVDDAFSKARLEELLNEQTQDITNALLKAYPKIGSAYSIEEARLYEQGDWYGSLLVPNATSDEEVYSGDDILRVIAHKTDGAWILVTKPPALSLSKFEYPDVPVDILRDLNNLQ